MPFSGIIANLSKYITAQGTSGSSTMIDSYTTVVDTDSYLTSGSIFKIPSDGYYQFCLNWRAGAAMVGVIADLTGSHQYSDTYGSDSNERAPTRYSRVCGGGWPNPSTGRPANSLDWYGYMKKDEILQLGFWVDRNDPIEGKLCLRLLNSTNDPTICKMRLSERTHMDAAGLIEWVIEDIDTDSMWSGSNPTRITIPATGYYFVYVSVLTITDDDFTPIYVKKNGTTEVLWCHVEYIYDAWYSPISPHLTIVGILSLNANDYLEVGVSNDGWLEWRTDVPQFMVMKVS